MMASPAPALRPAIFARQGWYPSTRPGVESMLDEFAGDVGPVEAAPALGLIVPHAGWRFSGAVAYRGYAAVEPIPRRVLILCTAHRTARPDLALWPADGGDWETPIGTIAYDAELAAHLAQHCPDVREDRASHEQEHAGEIQLPFLKRRRDDVRVAILNVARHPRRSRFDDLECAGRSIGEALATLTADVREDGGVLLVASSDLSHEEPAAVTRSQDRHVLDALVTLDPHALHDAVAEHNVTMCGAGAAVIMMVAAQVLGATRTKVLEYRTSADVTRRENDYTVGYAAVAVR